jgi:hypothetical protein
MNQAKIKVLEDEKQALIKEKDEMINETKYLGQKFNTPKPIVEQSIAHIMSEFQQTMEVIIKEQEGHRK